MQFKHVTLDIDGPVAILKLDHQEVMNAVSMDMLEGLPRRSMPSTTNRRSSLRGPDGGRARLLHRRQSAGPQ